MKQKTGRKLLRAFFTHAGDGRGVVVGYDFDGACDMFSYGRKHLYG